MSEYRHGSWNTICDRCGFKYKAGQLRLEWTGYRVCYGGGTNDCWEPRHPQDFVKPSVDRQAPPWVRPEQNDTIQSEYVNAELLSGDVLANVNHEEVLEVSDGSTSVIKSVVNIL